MAKVQFTAARVDAHKCPAGKSQSFLWDSKVPGLGLRATASGAKAYIFQGKVQGATVRMTIGSPDVWQLESVFKRIDGENREIVRGARSEARSLQSLVDSGVDPREVKVEQRAAHAAKKDAARRKAATVAEAWADYLKHLRTTISPKTKKPRSDRYLADHAALAAPGGEKRKRGEKLTTRGPLAPLLELNLTALTATKIGAWLESEARTRPTNAAHAYRLLKAFIRWCDGNDTYSGVIPAESYRSAKVTGALPQSRTKAGDSLQREQLSAWFEAVRALPNPVLAAYLQALLITGARREEIATLRWADVDLKWRSMALADKVETETGRIIPLPPYLANLLTALPRRNQWVFSSPKAKGGHIAEPRYAHNRALAAAGLPHVSLHGLRRSFGTLSEWCEVPVGIVAQIQGHKPSAIAEKHYRRRPLDMLRLWHDKVEAWMLEQAGLETDEAKPGLKAIAVA